MKYVLILAGAAMFAAPAYAETAYRTTIAHEGHSVPVAYDAKVETTKQQIGAGPRLTAMCNWKTEVTVQRTTQDPEGRPIAALSRTVEGSKVSSGSQVGICAAVPDRSTAAFGGNPEKMKAFLAVAATSDAPQLRTELASIAPSHRTVAR